ncbi:PucR family transcriptional regulator [Actinokineospora iranica]|uniref:PucR C-terminal helix-turn-helix domain-containing protein n=1 Tax=Actinokineospora iranica TaxID=1271860 RepID=A0A1G6ZH44_9PSEU|nr:PucR family transcriptional regulator [Actinokineospora iranica]SDE01577.1 PucR C-terminal helix-turn-helix domain-containing protein [Actinokineospora iranica]
MSVLSIVEQGSTAAEPDWTFEQRLRREIVAELGQTRPEAFIELTDIIDPLVETIRKVVLSALDSMTNPRSTRQEDWGALLRAQRGRLSSTCPLSVLVRAYRISGDIAWQQVRRYARHRDLPASALARGAEVVFAYLGELSSLAAPMTAPTAAARARLLRLLLTDPAPAEAEIADAAREAGWTPPPAVRIVALRRPKHHHGHLAHVPHLVDIGVDIGDGVGGDIETGDGILATTDGDEPCLLVPATMGGAEVGGVLREALPGWSAALGPATEVTRARESLRIAARALDMAERGLLPMPAHRVIDYADHRLALALFADEALVASLVEHRLAPLSALTPQRRERMLDTLHEWLGSQGRVSEIAARLNLHTQSVRYRIRQIEEVFGDRLADPTYRFELALATRMAILRRDNERSARGRHDDGPTTALSRIAR